MWVWDHAEAVRVQRMASSSYGLSVVNTMQAAAALPTIVEIGQIYSSWVSNLGV
jgi:hypothetical protein